MKVRIKETGSLETLSIIDPASGCDYVADYIGNTGALSDGQFARSGDDDVFECDQDTYDWWSAVLDRQAAVDERVESLKQEHGWERVYKALDGVDSVDFGDQPAAVMAALYEEFGPNQE